MNALYKRRKANQKGFTLIELIVVIAILVILAAVAIPSISGMQKQAKIGVIIANASEVANAINVYNAANPATPISGTVTSALGETGGALATAGLAPKFSDSDAKTLALSYSSVTITNGVAQVASKTSIESAYDSYGS
jgi:prepilin-type N-terminal cleavage/methylation domain-containing protein